MKVKTGKSKSRANWQKLNELFAIAVDLDPTAQADFVQQISDEFLRIELAAMLSAVQKADKLNFLKEDAFSIGAEVLVSNETSVNDRIGKYKVVREIGRGGMGVVFLAEREDFRQQVALKIIKRGMDSDEIVRRFHQERQVLATLSHPNIARLLDGGTTEDGLPFFVMEYIEGETITKYCDANKLGFEERLNLFRKVCAAVAYAHQNLVVHRDIKPSNILVDKGGEPKLLDFGISKLLAPNAFESQLEQTATGVNPLTPEYASPEQIRGEKITTASDIYSLGVLLYELLSGHRPFISKDKSYDEVVKLVLTQEPLRPSSVVSNELSLVRKTDENKAETQREIQNPKSKIRNLKGDLDNIVLMSLRKEPERRYNSVQEFSDDIRRHLTGLPVIATADTRLYRFSKFVGRNKIGTAIAAVILLLSGFAIWQGIVANRERARAEQRFNQVRKLANTVLFDYHERIKNLPGATETRKKLVTDALEYLDNLAQNSDDSPDLQRELALAYQKVGEIQGSYAQGGNTGETGAALENYHKAIAIQEKLVSMFPGNDADRRTLANLYAAVGFKTADLQSRENFCRKAVEILNELVEKDPLNTTTRTDLANALYFLAASMEVKGNYDEAIAEYRRSGEIYKNLALIDDGTEKRAGWLRSVALSYKAIGVLLEYKKDSVSALELYRNALAIDIENSSANPNNVQYKLDSAFSYNSIASALTTLANFEEARENCQKALAIQEKVVSDDPKNSFSKFAVARTFRRMGGILQSLEKFDEAGEHYQKSIQKMEEIVRSDPNDNGQNERLAELYSVYGEFLYKSALRKESRKLSGLREAQTFQKRALEIFTNLKSQNKLSKISETILATTESSLQKTNDELANFR